MFLTSYTPSEAFSFLSFLLDVSRMQNVLKRIAACIRSSNEELAKEEAVIAVYRSDIEALKKASDTLSCGLQPLEIRAGEALKLLQDLGSMDQALKPLPPLRQEVESLSASIKALTLSDLDECYYAQTVPVLVHTIPDIMSAEALVASRRAAKAEVAGAMDEVCRMGTVLDSLQTDSLVDEIPLFMLAESNASLYQKAAVTCLRYQAEVESKTSSLESLKTEGLEATVLQLRQAEGMLRQWACASHEVGMARVSVPSVPPGTDVKGGTPELIASLRTAESLLVKFVDITHEVATLTRSLHEATEGQVSVQSEMDSFSGSITCCPYCDSALDSRTKSVLLTKLGA
jgi:hypothetical protein